MLPKTCKINVLLYSQITFNFLREEIYESFDDKHRSRRSDIDSRLIELQAKIDIVNAFKHLPAGHGKFDFDRM